MRCKIHSFNVPSFGTRLWGVSRYLPYDIFVDTIHADLFEDAINIVNNDILIKKTTEKRDELNDF